MTDSISAARAELAPTGTLRVALNMSNFLLTAIDPVTGEPCGLLRCFLGFPAARVVDKLM